MTSNRSTRKIGNEYYKKVGQADSHTQANSIKNRYKVSGHKVRIISEGQGKGYIIVAKSK